MNGYKARVADVVLAEKLAGKGAVLIEGAKWCGKTTTAEQIAKSVLYMGDKDNQKRNLAMADFKPSRLLEGLKPRLLDEWQIAPKLWDTVRFAVDHTQGMGHFILTGSTVPEEKRADIDHSGTGRICRMRMRPMSLWESGESAGTVSLANLLRRRSFRAFGLVFETLVARDLRVYADALDGKVRHYLDKSGLECDFVIGLRDGRSGLVEVKLGGDTLIEEGATSLNALFAKLDTSKTRTPSFRMIVVADGDFAYRRKDGVIVCPIAALKP